MRPLHPVPKIDLGGGYSLEALQGMRTADGTKAAVTLLNGTPLFGDVLLLSKEDGWGAFVEQVCHGRAVTTEDVASALRALARSIEAVLRGPGAAAALTDQDGPYLISQGCICWRHSTPEGREVITPLANFDATITAERVVDDGATVRRELELEGRLASGRSLAPVTISSSQFTGMGWVVDKWGSRAVVIAGQGAKDRLREALQRLSGDVPQRLVYGHTGWRQIGKQWAYLHAGGVITAGGPLADDDGPLTFVEAAHPNPLETRISPDTATQDGPKGPNGTLSVEIELSPPLRYLQLPKPPEGEPLRAAVRASLRLLQLAPGHPGIMVPLLGMAYRAPLAEVARPDYVAHVAGGTGRFKTEIAVLLQQHYGADWSRLHLPAGWHATGNAMERIAFEAKDALVVIDDFAPAGPSTEVAKLHATANRLFREVGNGAGRGRMAIDGTLRAEYPPRAVVVSTGEDVPTGKSIRARCAIVEVGADTISVEQLTAAQEAGRRGDYAAATAGYVRWLAGQLDELRERFRARAEGYRLAFTQSGMHRRTPTVAADLATAWSFWLDFAASAAAITPEERAATWGLVWQGLKELTSEQSAHQEDQDPTEQYVALLSSAITSGKAHLLAFGGGQPQDPDAWGWRHRLVGSGDGLREEWQPQGDTVGWLDGKNIYLDPKAALGAVGRLARDTGGSLAVTERTLYKRLHEKGLLVSVDPRGGVVRYTVRKNVRENDRRAVLHLLSRLEFRHFVRA